MPTSEAQISEELTFIGRISSEQIWWALTFREPNFEVQI